jgi:hypothetical protein
MTKDKKPQKTAKQGATKKRTKADKKSEPIARPEENRAGTPVDWFDELKTKQRKKDLAAVLKHGEMPVDDVRFIIRTIYNDLNQHAPRICNATLGELIRARIIQPGPQWDESLAPSMMAKHLWMSPEAIEDRINTLIAVTHGIFKDRRRVSEPHRIVYDCYKWLRIKTGAVSHERNGRELWKEVWRIAGQEPAVKAELEKSPMKVKDFKDTAQENARVWFRDEIKSLLIGKKKKAEK